MENRNSKRYYWLKLNENFFEREEIKVIEGMPNGKDYIIFYMKLLLKSIGTEGSLRFRDIIPYTPEMLSTITNTDIDTVRVATDLFVQLELMEKWDDGTLFMAETQNMIGSETGWAKKKRIQREEKDIVPELSLDCPTELDTELELDKEKELDTEGGSGGDFQEIINLFQNNGFGLINENTSRDLIDLEEFYTRNWLIEAMEISIDNNKRSLSYTKAILKRWYAEGKDEVQQQKPKSDSWKVDAS